MIEVLFQSVHGTYSLPSSMQDDYLLGPVVRKPINSNPRLKVNPDFSFAR